MLILISASLPLFLLIQYGIIMAYGSFPAYSKERDAFHVASVFVTMAWFSIIIAQSLIWDDDG